MYNLMHVSSVTDIGVQMGRFCPYTQGHALITAQLYRDFGSKSLLIVGSKNAFRWPDVPFTAEQRIDLIRRSISYPIEICGLDDSNPHDKTAWDLQKWWASLRQLEEQKHASFVFYGGSEEDLQYHREGGFKTHVAVDRVIEGQNIAATEIRQLLGIVIHAQMTRNDARYDDAMNKLKAVMPHHAIESAIDYFHEGIIRLQNSAEQNLIATFAPSPSTV